MILLPKPPKVVSKKTNWAQFEIEALSPGYGITIGNSLRRVLLSSLPGAAVTQMKIKGVQHEFSTIPGVLEDVITIAMNLKQLRFKTYTDEPQKVFLKVKGEKEVSGSDFKFPSQVELVNKSVHIATITSKKTELDMEIKIEKGIGYESVERRKRQGKLEIGVIPLDAIFGPIERVSYKVENMRVGERTDFNRLYLDVTTDGTITPEEAFSRASEILIEHFSLFTPLEITGTRKKHKENKSLTGFTSIFVQKPKKEEKITDFKKVKTEKKAKKKKKQGKEKKTKK